jgi:hypothetical protein
LPFAFLLLLLISKLSQSVTQYLIFHQTQHTELSVQVPIPQSIKSQSDKHSIKMSGQQSKADLIAERQANLPLPEDPPVASDWNSADARTVNVSSGERQGEISTGAASSTGLREPATQGSGVREEEGADLSGVGRQGKEGLSGPPKDATSR